MSWQTPKINWAPPDGIRDADMNRIEENTLYLYNMNARSSITMHVAPPPSAIGGGTGSNETGNGSAARPYATIQHALNQLPKSINGQVVTINIAAGTYNEDVIVADFAGYINITGLYNAEVIVKSLTIRSCSCSMSNVTLRATAGIKLEYNAMLMSTSTIIVSGGTVGVTVSSGSTCIINATLSIYGISSVGIRATNASMIYILSFTMNNVSIAVEAQQGSIVSYGSTSMTITAAAFVTMTGGRIYSGSQSSLPGGW